MRAPIVPSMSAVVKEGIVEEGACRYAGLRRSRDAGVRRSDERWAAGCWPVRVLIVCSLSPWTKQQNCDGERVRIRKEAMFQVAYSRNEAATGGGRGRGGERQERGRICNADVARASTHKHAIKLLLSFMPRVPSGPRFALPFFNSVLRKGVPGGGGVLSP